MLAKIRILNENKSASGDKEELNKQDFLEAIGLNNSVKFGRPPEKESMGWLYAYC